MILQARKRDTVMQNRIRMAIGYRTFPQLKQARTEREFGGVRTNLPAPPGSSASSSKTGNHYGITAREIVRVRTRALTSYRGDMAKPELRLWRKRYIVMPADKRQSSPAQACDEDMFPNISVILASSNVLRVRAKCQCFASPN